MAILSAVLGALGLPDDDYAFARTMGQESVFNNTQQLLGDHNGELAAAEALFVEGTTSMHSTRYYDSTGSRLDKVTNQTRSFAMKAAGSWDVAYPLEEFGARIEGNRVQMAYMSAAQYGRHVTAVLNSDVNTRRYEMLKAIFNNGAGAPRVFLDENWGNLNVQPLANGDATLYPPLVGSEVKATSNHFLVTQYAPGAIDDTHEPISAAVDLLEGQFGIPTMGSNLVTFINKAQVALITGLTLFNPIETRFQMFGDNISKAVDWLDPLPGASRVLGEFAGKGIIVRWDWIPANYTLTMHMDAPRPLMKRVDPPETGLSSGLQLVAVRKDHPFMGAEWSNRFGYGVGNRLNGVVTFIDAGSTYTTPTIYQ